MPLEILAEIENWGYKTNILWLILCRWV